MSLPKAKPPVMMFIGDEERLTGRSDMLSSLTARQKSCQKNYDVSLIMTNKVHVARCESSVQP